MSKYLVSVGHTAKGNIGSGASKYLDESTCTREIAPLVVKYLQELGHTAIKLQIDNNDAKDYVKRTNQANQIGGDLFLEIHLNSGGGNGCEVLTTSGSKASTQAVRISQCISKTLGITNRGYKTTSELYVLNHTSMPALLIECCFVDSQADYKAYNADKIARAIVEGITGQSVLNKIKTGWQQDLKGWWYVYSDGSYPKSKWFQVGSEWYYADEKGYCYQNRWLKDNDKWYYFNNDCKMVKNTTLTYSFNEKGEWIK